MENVIAFRRPDSMQPIALPNPSFQPAAIVDLMTPRERKRLARQEAEPATDTARNLRMRQLRRRVWTDGMVRVNYYKVALDMENAIGSAQNRGIAEGKNHPKISPEFRLEVIGRYRAAVRDQILRQASCIADVEWKRRQVGDGAFKYCGLTEERALQAIDADLAFLRDHPVRKAKCV